MPTRVNVVFYGRLKQDVGTKQDTLTLDDSPTVRGAVQALTTRYPALTPLLETVAFTVGAELVAPDAALHDGDELGLLPPVSGG